MYRVYEIVNVNGKRVERYNVQNITILKFAPPEQLFSIAVPSN